ncbi:N-acetylmuramoyl-L-alanine amidase [Actinomyces faecalis]|uniref:peptidoglycan recognition protein family protein n=1 Tax=Actinomyces faecalis TaxID=2722820 RepID=UPI001C12E966|nr:peptidoglycan recognition family protein [Actinomyces faecalis]
MTKIVPNSAVTDVRQSPNFSAGRPAGAPNQVVIHHWGADGQTHQGVVDYLCRSSNHGASAHYVASAGRVTQLVSDRDRAWHAGPSGNPRGIGIECRPECSDGDFETVAGLVAAIRSEHGNLPLVGHRDHMSTACPGRWYARLADLDARARALAGGAPAKPATGGLVLYPLAVDGQWGPATGARVRQVLGTAATAPWSQVVRALQYALTWQLDTYKMRAATGEDHLVVDGVDGPKTIKAFQAWWNQSGIPEGHKVPLTGVWDTETYRAVQITLNHSWAGSKGLAVHP